MLLKEISVDVENDKVLLHKEKDKKKDHRGSRFVGKGGSKVRWPLCFVCSYAALATQCFEQRTV